MRARAAPSARPGAPGPGIRDRGAALADPRRRRLRVGQAPAAPRRRAENRELPPPPGGGPAHRRASCDKRPPTHAAAAAGMQLHQGRRAGEAGDGGDGLPSRG